MQRGEPTCHVASHGVTHDIDGTEVERRPELGEILDECFPGIVPQVSALTVPALIERDDTTPAFADALHDHFVRIC